MSLQCYMDKTLQKEIYSIGFAGGDVSPIKSRKMTASLNVKILLNPKISILKKRIIPRKIDLRNLRLEGQDELKPQPRLPPARSPKLRGVRLPAAGSGRQKERPSRWRCSLEAAAAAAAPFGCGWEARGGLPAGGPACLPACLRR